MSVILEIETEDARMLNPSVASVDETRALREAVIASLPGGVKRVIAVFSVEEAMLMCMAHEHALRESGLGATKFPPEDYVTPDDKPA